MVTGLNLASSDGLGAWVQPAGVGAAEWQRGVDLASLKALTATFKAAQERHVYGAFALMREREIADAVYKHELYVAGSMADGMPGAAAIVRRCNGRKFSTFDGTARDIPRKSFIIDAIAVLSMDSGRELMGTLNCLFKGERVYAEVFEEDAMTKACLNEHGYHWVDTCVMAASELRGLYVKHAETVDYPRTDKAELATLALLTQNFLKGDRLKVALQEAKLAGDYAQHYSNYNRGGAWTALSLLGYDDDPTFVIRPDEMSKGWKSKNEKYLAAQPRKTSLWAQCPTLANVVSECVPGGNRDRVRLMKLAPNGGELTRHADITLRDAGVADGKIARLHVPLQTNPDVLFTQWDARGNMIQRHFPAGVMFYLDQRKPHTAKNGGAEDRIHLVIDVCSDDELRSSIAWGVDFYG